ncbi:MAG TPA: L,D-transpeptidase, partial [Candidatus Eisenbacteria bacterium]|nr:L,D-transpeptidase [Candidatus Eisenbacteria bacterium]
RWAARYPKAIVVHKEWQVFGAYEGGRLIRWGPISSGRRTMRTPEGLFYLNWRSSGRRSTVNRNWYLRWYYNFENHKGLSFHQYALPGRPASHACIRLLERDAQWIYHWGESWQLDRQGRKVLARGTPVLVLEAFDFGSAPPWRSPLALRSKIELPSSPHPVAL